LVQERKSARAINFFTYIVSNGDNIPVNRSFFRYKTISTAIRAVTLLQSDTNVQVQSTHYENKPMYNLPAELYSHSSLVHNPFSFIDQRPVSTSLCRGPQLHHNTTDTATVQNSKPVSSTTHNCHLCALGLFISLVFQLSFCVFLTKIRHAFLLSFYQDTF
jgi:hypothetical protein